MFLTAYISCSAKAKSLVFTGLVQPLLEYACSVWILHGSGNIAKLESVQIRAAHWICKFVPVIYGQSCLLTAFISCIGQPFKLLHYFNSLSNFTS